MMWSTRWSNTGCQLAGPIRFLKPIRLSTDTYRSPFADRMVRTGHATCCGSDMVSPLLASYFKHTTGFLAPHVGPVDVFDRGTRLVDSGAELLERLHGQGLEPRGTVLPDGVHGHTDVSAVRPVQDHGADDPHEVLNASILGVDPVPAVLLPECRLSVAHVVQLQTAERGQGQHLGNPGVPTSLRAREHD